VARPVAASKIKVEGANGVKEFRARSHKVRDGLMPRVKRMGEARFPLVGLGQPSLDVATPPPQIASSFLHQTLCVTLCLGSCPATA